MKRYIPLFLLLTLVLSACTIRFDIGVEVNEDESGTFSLFVGLDEELRQLAEQSGGDDLDITEGIEDVPEGWDVEEVTEDGFEGVRVTADFASFEELDRRIGELEETTSAGVSTEFLTDFGLTREGDEFRFTVNVTGLGDELAGTLGEQGGEDLLSGLDTSSLIEDLFQIRFRLTLPGEIGANNADLVEGNTLTWNVGLSDDGGAYEAVSTVGGGNSALLLGAAAVAAIVAIGVGATAVKRRKVNAATATVEGAPISTDAPPVDPLIDG
ncbi:MAG: hypothetical protein GY926_11105 [bacterium]|nr:hypothetical protein [bacterium]MCP4965774.1 hypothetical protein [bacterium]